MALNARAFVFDLLRQIKKFDPNQLRDYHGRWTSGATYTLPDEPTFEDQIKEAKGKIVSGNVSIHPDAKADFVANDGMARLTKYMSKILEATGMPKVDDIVIIKGWGGRFVTTGKSTMIDIGVNWFKKSRRDMITERIKTLGKDLKVAMEGVKHWTKKWQETHDEFAAQKTKMLAEDAGTLSKVMKNWITQLRSPDALLHSMFAFKDPAEAVIAHELGHHFHDKMQDAIDRGVFQLPAIGRSRQSEWNREKAERLLTNKIALTARGRDSWQECVAENFALFWAGQTKGMDRRFVDLFKATVKKLDGKTFVDHVIFEARSHENQ